MGLIRPDFMALTPAEFAAAYSIWKDNSEAQFRDQWERTRLVASCSLIPHSRKIRKPSDYFLFPWEKEKEKTGPVAVLSKEDRRKRMDELVEKWK